MDLNELIKPELLILIPVLYLIGVGLKKSAVVPNHLIPLILGGAGVVLALLYFLVSQPFNAETIFSAITQGILCAGMTVYANQMYQQLKKGGTEG